MNISVVVPVWNRADLLERAISSVMSQTLSPHELIIVDDGSTDSTPQIIAELYDRFRASDIKFRSMCIDHCGMAGKVRNIGVKVAVGDWIAFLDSDDEWLPHKLERQCAEIERSNMRWCHTRERWIRDGKVKSQKKMTHARRGDIFEDALQKCIIGPSTVLIQKNLFEELGYFREDLEIAEDYELWLRFLSIYPIAYIDEELIIKYAGHEHQLSSKYEYIENFRIEALKKLVEKNSLCYNRKTVATKKLLEKQQIWERGRVKYGT